MRSIKAKEISVLALLALVCIAAVGVSYLAYVQMTEKKFAEHFDFRVRESVQDIESRMTAYEEVLRGAAGLFRASKAVSRKAFNTYTSSLRLADHFPGIQGIGYSLIVPADELKRHIDAVRAEGFPTYSLHPTGKRDLYTAAVYIEPFSDRNLRAFGFDMFSEPVRQDAMQRAIDNDRVAMTGKVRLVQESGRDEQSGFLMYIPIYEADMPHTLVSDRRKYAVGWVYAVFRMGDFISSAKQEHDDDLGVEIFDGKIMSDEHRMFTSQGLAAAEENRLNENFRDKSIRVADRFWSVRFHAMPSLKLRLDYGKPMMFAAFGLLGTLLLVVVVWLLLTGRRRAREAALTMNKELIHEQQRLSTILEGTRVGTWEWNMQSGAATLNEAWAQMMGYTLDELAPATINTWVNLGHPEDIEKAQALLQHHVDGQTPHYECEMRMRHKSGHWVWVLTRGKVVTWALDGKPLLMLGIQQDITDKKMETERLLQKSLHDNLTGLPNRVLMADRLSQAIEAAKRNQTLVALMFIDLDEFKPINDTYGHDVGDELLKKVAKRMRSCIRDSDTVARYGGDEFVALLPSVASETLALEVAEKIRIALSLPFDLQAQTVSVSSSIGLVMYPSHGDDEVNLIRRADMAMYDAKFKGRNTVCVFDFKMLEHNAPASDVPKEDVD